MTETMDHVTLHQPHGSGKMIRPNRFRSVFLFGFPEGFGNGIQRIIPADRLELARSLWANAPQGLSQPIRVVDPFPVRGNLGADHTIGVIIQRIAPDPAYFIG